MFALVDRIDQGPGMYEVTDKMPPHARVVLMEPREGWTLAFFEREMAQYAVDRGAAPRTVTMHPDTMSALGFHSSWVMGTSVNADRGPILVSSSDYATDRMTLYE